jgi:hypothetical protein
VAGLIDPPGGNVLCGLAHARGKKKQIWLRDVRRLKDYSARRAAISAPSAIARISSSGKLTRSMF